MKKFFAASAAMLFVACSAYGQSTTFNRIGDTTYGADAYTGQAIGGTTSRSFATAVSTASKKTGDATYNDLGNGNSATSQRIGNTTYLHLGQGVSGTSQRTRNTTYHNVGGKYVACQTIGGTVYCS